MLRKESRGGRGGGWEESELLPVGLSIYDCAAAYVIYPGIHHFTLPFPSAASAHRFYSIRHAHKACFSMWYIFHSTIVLHPLTYFSLESQIHALPSCFQRSWIAARSSTYQKKTYLYQLRGAFNTCSSWRRNYAAAPNCLHWQQLD